MNIVRTEDRLAGRSGGPGNASALWGGPNKPEPPPNPGTPGKPTPPPRPEDVPPGPGRLPEEPLAPEPGPPQNPPGPTEPPLWA